MPSDEAKVALEVYRSVLLDPLLPHVAKQLKLTTEELDASVRLVVIDEGFTSTRFGNISSEDNWETCKITICTPLMGFIKKWSNFHAASVTDPGSGPAWRFPLEDKLQAAERLRRMIQNYERESERYDVLLDEVPDSESLSPREILAFQMMAYSTVFYMARHFAMLIGSRGRDRKTERDNAKLGCEWVAKLSVLPSEIRQMLAEKYPPFLGVMTLETTTVHLCRCVARSKGRWSAITGHTQNDRLAMMAAAIGCMHSAEISLVEAELRQKRSIDIGHDSAVYWSKFFQMAAVKAQLRFSGTPREATAFGAIISQCSELMEIAYANG